MRPVPGNAIGAAGEDRDPGGQPPFGPAEVQAMSRAISPVSCRPYGLAAVCRGWRISRSGVYRHQLPVASTPARRPGPTGPMPDAALVEEIRAVLATSRFHGEG